MALQHLYTGVGGWQSPEWADLQKGLLPSRTPVLEIVSRFAGCVEVDSTRDRALKPEAAHVWMRQVERNPHFRFNPILKRQFTHDRMLNSGDVAHWMNGVRPFWEAGRLGCVVMEFPWAFRFTVENRAHLIELRRTFHPFPVAAEFRHESWLREEAQGTLIDFRIGFVNLDQPAYFRGMPPAGLLTSPTGYIRLHGRAGVDWFREFSPRLAREPYLYPAAELQEWAERAARLSTHADAVYITASEPAGMLALLHSLRLRALLDDRFRQAPPEMLKRYWGELAGFSASKPVQGTLAAFRQAVA